MATKSSGEGKHSFASILIVIILFGSIAVLALVPVDTFQVLRQQEQKQLVYWLGAESDQWIMDRILDGLEWINRESGKMMEEATVSGNTKIDAWLINRIHAATIWTHVIMYRIGMIIMWTAFALPCLLAAYVDGYFERQVAKASFTSQSPRLHKAGVDMAVFVSAALVAWIFAPVFVSTLVAPIAIGTLSFAWWVWMANLQKRL